MKKLLIMSMALLFGVTSGFSQVQTRTVKTVKSNSAAMDEIKQKTSDAYNAVKNQASREILKKKTGTKNDRVTKPSKTGTQSKKTLELLTDDWKPTNSNGRVTRPSRTESQSKKTLELLTDDWKPTNSNGRVTRPSSNVGTKGREGGVNDLILLDGGDKKGNSKVGTKGKIGDGGVQDMWDDSRMKPTNGKTNVVNRRGGTRRR
jgi:hypothetical protein